MNKRTKIVCTIGPACNTRAILQDMIRAGMNVARLNFSHGTHDEHEMVIQRIRHAADALHEPVAILQDLQGPKIRLGALPHEGMACDEGGTVVFDTSIKTVVQKRVPVDYIDLHRYVKKGERLLIADGKIEMRVTSVKGSCISTKTIVGGVLFSHKGINVPDSHIPVRSLTQKDEQDLRFGVFHDVDIVAVSFVRSAKDIQETREKIALYEKEFHKKGASIMIIAKIERREAVEDIENILEAADGIMVARGDLGVEIPAEQVPIVQKDLIKAALVHEKPVIVATQMLASMEENPRATRAEVSDVANAVIDHTDAVMLSNETATGKYPVEAVETMAAVIVQTEQSPYDNLGMPKEGDALGALSRLLAERADARLIVTASLSGATGRAVARYRPELPIFVGTPLQRVVRQLNLSWGISSFLLPPCKTDNEITEKAVGYIKKHRCAKVGEEIIVALKNSKKGNELFAEVQVI